jgi:signal peptidase I
MADDLIEPTGANLSERPDEPADERARPLPEPAARSAEAVAASLRQPGVPEHHNDDQTTISEYLESLLVTVILALFGTSFIVQAFKIPSPSMEGTLLVGDHLLVNKFIFGGTGTWYEKILPYRKLERGDIIVFKYPYADHQHFVKRVIGLPGEHLKLVDGQMFVNGKVLDEPYVQHDPAAIYDPLNSDFPPPAKLLISSHMISEWAQELPKYIVGDEIVVPPGKYFAMGDNRDSSSDSRYWGFVDRGAIMGRPFLIYWSVDATTADYAKETTFFSRLTSVFDNIRHLPARTRWGRMLHTVH